MRPSLAASLFLVLLAGSASADCLTPAWEVGTPLPSVGSVSTTTVVDDFDGDGNADVVFVRSDAGQRATLQRGKGNGFFATPVDLYAAPWVSFSQPAIHHVLARDLNRDGNPDLLLVENRTRLVFLPGNGDGTFANPVFSSADVGVPFAIADLTGDDANDVVAFYSNATSSGVVLFAGSFFGTFVEATRFPLPAPSSRIAVGDLDGDGANDLVIGYGDDHDASLDLLFGNDDGTFDPAVPRASGDSWANTLKLADLENDGDLDIVAVSFEGVSVHRNRGGRTFDAVTTYRVSDPYNAVKHSIHVAVADVTGDGVRDLLVAASNNLLATLRGLGDATFDSPRYKQFSGPSVSMAPIDTTDFDGDGRIDVLLGPTGFGGLHALRNRCGDVNVLLTATPPADPAEYNVTTHVSIHGYDDALEEPPSAQATGTVSILAGETVLATGALSNGEVTLNVRGLTRGAHKLVARYSGDEQYEPAQSAPVIARVTQRPATTPPPPRRRAVRR